MSVEEAVRLIQSILSAQKLTIQEHKQVQDAFALILKTRKRPKLAGGEESSDGDDAVQLQGASGQGQ